MTFRVSGVWGSLDLFEGRNWTTLKSRKLISRISLAISFHSRIFLAFLFSFKIHNENSFGIAMVHARSVNLLADRRGNYHSTISFWKSWWLCLGMFVMPGILIFIYIDQSKLAYSVLNSGSPRSIFFLTSWFDFKKASPALLDLRTKSSFCRQTTTSFPEPKKVQKVQLCFFFTGSLEIPLQCLLKKLY